MDIETIVSIALFAIPTLIAVVLHEIAHGWVAYLRGDPTAKLLGRLTLNPLPHIDPVGSILFPAFLYFMNAPFLFGWARPVPVDTSRLYHPKRDMVWVAIAGPATNMLLAVVASFGLHALSGDLSPLEVLRGGTPSPLFEILLSSVLINVGLAVFNLLPILPLDGGRVLFGILPMPLARLFAQTESYGLLLVMLLSSTEVLGRVTRPLRVWLLDALL